VVSAAGDEAAEAVIEKVCCENGSSLYRVGRDIRWREVDYRLGRQEIDIEGISGRYTGLVLSLSGRHQQANAAAAVGAVEIVRGFGRGGSSVAAQSASAVERTGWEIGDGAIRRGLLEARWPGRLEVVRDEPLVIIDGAHNPAGARALREAVRELVPDRRIILLIGILGDKAVGGILGELVPLASEVVVTRANYQRALNVDELGRKVRAFGVEPRVTRNVSEGIEQALELARPEDLVLCAGSLYLIGELRPILRES